MYTTSYQSAVVSICTIFEIFDVEEIVTLNPKLGVTHCEFMHHL